MQSDFHEGDAPGCGTTVTNNPGIPSLKQTATELNLNFGGELQISEKVTQSFGVENP